uniref:Beta-fructofuranosidase, insoluble isoenzyme 5 n=1 Tax=Aegilops tauschii TaxID=37682 RepID=N1R516_AEGTA
MNGAEKLNHGRTAYHFQPAKYWQNGPMYHNGMYHFFYQYNPRGPTWGDGKLSWGHSVSGDLVNWADVGNALDPTSPFDVNGCWSGSATVLPGGRPAILYTGMDDADKAQVQNVAFAKNPSDPLLREWEKPSCNPVIPMPADVTGNNFRDPTEAWRGRDGLWRGAVAAEVRGVGSLLVYRSADFLHWERNAGAPLHAASSRDGDGPAVLECPDLFPMAGTRRDGGARRVGEPRRGAGTLQADVQAVFEVPNLEDAETLDPKWLQDPKGLCAEKGASVPGGVGPFGLLVMASGDLREHTSIFFRVFKHLDTYKVLMCTDLTKSSTKAEGVKIPSYGAFLDVDVEKDKSLSLRTLIDHTVVESFGDGGRTCMTPRRSAEHAAGSRSRLYAFNYGAGAVKVSKLEAWELATAAVNGGGVI